jgi:gamma-glutamyltranspeptidase/glutathione hydrolase
MKRATLLAVALFALPLFAGSVATGSRAALATSSPYATRVGLEVLQHGGSAADAAVAVAFVLGVVHPQSGIGGGGLLTYYDASSGAVWTLDFRETAPAAIKPGMLGQKASGPMTGAVPGTVAGLDAMHKRFGTRPWTELLAPAIRIAHNPAPADVDLAADAARVKRERGIDALADTHAADLAAFLERLSVKGAGDFYTGEIAHRLVTAVRAAGGVLSLRDLREYQPVWRAPIRLSYRNYDVYAPAPPSSGGLVIGEALNILSTYDLTASGARSATTVHLMLEATRRATMDRDKYVADPAVRPFPYRQLLSNERAQHWRSSIDPLRATPTITLGEPTGAIAAGAHTTHFTIVDAQQNIAAVTITLGDDFGSGFLIPGCGFFLNDSLRDFAVDANAANSIQPGKRMASSMAPTIILRGGRPFLALGSSGGSSIPSILLQVFLEVGVFGSPIADAIAAPRFDQQAQPEDAAYEMARAPESLIGQLHAMGHGLRQQEALGEVNAVLIDAPRMTAVADPRRGGSAGAF